MQNLHSVFVFILKLQTDVSASLCFNFLQMTLTLNKFAQPCFKVYEK